MIKKGNSVLFSVIRLQFPFVYVKIYGNIGKDVKRMKKLILKTALITLGVALVVSISVFGIVSFCAPVAMMKLTASLGMESISGDYAYQEYQQSQDISYLALSFEIAADCQNDSVAQARFDELIVHDGFEAYCTEQDAVTDQTVSALSYRNYIYGKGVCVKYRLARTQDAKEAVYEYALQETPSFEAWNPVFFLSLEAVEAKDTAFCQYLLQNLPQAGFEENQNYLSVISILEEFTGNE